MTEQDILDELVTRFKDFVEGTSVYVDAIHGGIDEKFIAARSSSRIVLTVSIMSSEMEQPRQGMADVDVVLGVMVAHASSRERDKAAFRLATVFRSALVLIAEASDNLGSVVNPLVEPSLAGAEADPWGVSICQVTATLDRASITIPGTLEELKLSLDNALASAQGLPETPAPDPETLDLVSVDADSSDGDDYFDANYQSA